MLVTITSHITNVFIKDTTQEQLNRRDAQGDVWGGGQAGWLSLSVHVTLPAPGYIHQWILSELHCLGVF